MTLLLLARYSLLFVGMQYLILGSCFIVSGQKGLGWAYVFYALSNIGLYYSSLGV